MKIQKTETAISPLKPSSNNQTGLVMQARKNIGTFLEHLWELSGSIRLYKVDVLLIEGKEIHTGQPVSTLYIGHYDNFAFLIDKIYSDYEIREKHPKISSFQTKKWLRRYQDNVDLLFVDVELLYCKMLPNRQFIEIPQWIRQKLAVPNTWDEVMGKFRKNTKKTDLRKIRKYNITYKITRSEDDFKNFYRQMYRPYLEKRFEDAVIIEPEWKVMRQCRKGELLQITCQDEVIASVLLHNAEGRLAYVWVGVPDDLEADKLKGAFSAMYYYTILYGYEHGCNEIDFLGSRPLLNDGLFRYKRKWGTHVLDSPVPRGDILLKPLNLNAPIRSFFSHNHFIVREGPDLAGKIFFDNKAATKNDLEKISGYYSTRGIKHIKIFSFLGYDEDAEIWAENNSSIIRLVDLSKSSNPAATFCSK